MRYERGEPRSRGKHLRPRRPLCVRKLWQCITQWVREVATERGNRTSLLEWDTRLKREARPKMEIGTFTKREIQGTTWLGRKGKDRTGKQPKDERKNIRTFVPSLNRRTYYQYNSLQFMSSNSLKLGLLLGLHPNYFPRDCPCQHCRCSCHNYRLSQIII